MDAQAADAALTRVQDAEYEASLLEDRRRQQRRDELRRQAAEEQRRRDEAEAERAAAERRAAERIAALRASLPPEPEARTWRQDVAGVCACLRGLRVRFARATITDDVCKSLTF